MTGDTKGGADVQQRSLIAFVSAITGLWLFVETGSWVSQRLMHVGRDWLFWLFWACAWVSGLLAVIVLDLRRQGRLSK